MWRYIWEYVCVEERASEAPPAVVRRICGYVGLYVWWRERESEREGEGRGGRGWGRNNNNNPSSKPLDKHSTAQHTNRSTLESRRYHSSKRLSDSSDVVSVTKVLKLHILERKFLITVVTSNVLQ